MSLPIRSLIAVSVLAAAFALPARAEVSAQVDSEGRYETMIVRTNASTKNLRVWAVQRDLDRTFPLNREGDVNGDLWPAVLEVPNDDRWPWVVWSRFDGVDYDLAWSRWSDETGWHDVTWLTLASTPGNDVDPSMDFGASDGRPYVAWWRDVEGQGRVYLSFFLSSTWLEPYAVSPVDEDARYPTIDVLDDRTIRITYDTPAGPRTRTVKFNRPATITDNVDPFEYLKTHDDTTGGFSEGDSGP